jgi:8-oxo-dGTP diphosphatase
MSRKLLLVAAVALVDAKGRVLLAKRPMNKTLGGLWEFPGGKIETGESPEEGLKRELLEELDIIIDEDNLKPISFVSFCYEDFHLFMPLWALRIWENEPRSCEGQELAWVDIADIEKYPMPPADVPLIGRLREFLIA